MADAREVAEWLKAEVLKGGYYVTQDAAAFGIVNRFGKEFVYTRKGGGLGVSTQVLREFLKISKDTVVWSRQRKYWRPRQPDDPKSREVKY